MGVNEDQLVALGTTGAEWKIDYFSRLEQEMVEFESRMSAIRANPGWTGQSAQDAKHRVQELELHFAEIQEKLASARKAIDTANDLRAAAASKVSTLPSASIPWDVQLLLGAATLGTMVTIPFVGVFAAEVAWAKAREYYGKTREAAAQDILNSLSSGLEQPRASLRAAKISKAEWPEAPPAPDWPTEPIVYPGDSTGMGGWRTGGVVGGGGGGGGGTYLPPHNYPERNIVCPPPIGDPGWRDDDPQGPTLGVDGDINSGTTGGFGGGGGLGGGLAAGLGGAGALAAGSKLATSGGAGLFGANGILGGGPGGAGAGAGAAGGKSAAMMGGGGGGAGGGEKEKRSSLGLVAPKLEDDDEIAPRSAAAGAGGRE